LFLKVLDIYWKIWAHIHTMECNCCNQYFKGN